MVAGALALAPARLGRGAGAAPSSAGSSPRRSSRACSFSRALSASTRVPYLANRGDAFAAASTSSAGPIRDAGARRRVWTTGVGTPSSDRIVTAASPIPIDVSSSSTS